MLELSSCRICLKKETELLKTTTVANNSTYDAKLSFCVPEIDWACTDAPSLICRSCITLLETTATFRRLCLESDQTRRKFIEQLRNSPFTNQEYLTDLQSDLQVELICCDATCSSDGENETGTASKEVTEANLHKEETHEIKLTELRSSNKVKYFVRNKAIRKGSLKLKGKSETDPSFVKADGNTIRECKIINLVQNENIDNMKLYVPNRKDRTCIFCNCTFSKYATLANHIRSIHTLEKCFKCDTCGEGFTNAEILSRHKNRHTGERKYVCSYCGKKFFTNSDLNHHVQRHLNKRGYKCNICDKSFNTANSLRSHKLVVHTNPNEWKFLCTTCGRKCVTQAALTVHMKRHSKEKDFACHLCPKKFCTKPELSKHISSHSNLRLHKCEVCHQEYKDRKVMERHLTKKHGIGNAKIVEKIKKYVCDACPKRFVGKRQLEKHLRSHNGVRPFKCELCEQAFICSSYIKGHMRSRHSIDVQVD